MKVSGLLKIVVGVGLLVLGGMMYWSSLLQEKDLKVLRQQMEDLREEAAALRLKGLEQKVERVKRSEDKYPNLLSGDEYFEKTLPQMLGAGFRPQGIVKKGFVGKPENLHPFNGFRDVQTMISMCTVELADHKTGRYETFTPKMATKIEMRPCADNPDVHEYWIFLRDDVYWAPLQASHFPETIELAPPFLQKHPVTAHDFKFGYDAVMNTYMHEGKAAALRTYYNDIDTIRVIDDYTLVVRWKTHPVVADDGKKTEKVKYTSLGITTGLQPLPRFVYQYFADGQKIIEEEDDPDIYRKSSVWAQNFAQHWAKNVIVSCGAYLFDGMSDEGISFKRNPHFFNPYAVLVDGVKFTFKEGLDAIWQDFKAGKIDLCVLSPNQISELATFKESEEYKAQAAQGKAIKHLDYVDLSYFYLGWNQAKPYFSDVRVRKALTLAIDRGRIIEQNLNLMAVPTTGPFCIAFSSYDQSIKPYPFNPEEAKQLLEEAGWTDLDGDGIRDKMIDGEKVPFRFKLFYYVKNLSSKVIAEYISTALRAVGVHCELSGVDIADLSRQFEDKTFDAIFMGWKLGTPPEDPRQLWHSSGAHEKGSSNAVGFANAAVDAIIEKLNYEYDTQKRVSLYHQFHQIIYKEAPYTFLYIPKVRLVYREYVQNLFIPSERQDLIPGADVTEPSPYLIWLKK